MLSSSRGKPVAGSVFERAVPRRLCACGISHLSLPDCTVGSTVWVILEKTSTLVSFLAEHAREAKTASVLLTHTKHNTSSRTQEESQRERTQEKAGEGIIAEQDHNRF